MKSYLVMCLASLTLTACGREACTNLPVCLDTSQKQAQPSGYASSVTLAAGQTVNVVVFVQRYGTPDDAPVQLKLATIQYAPPPGSAPDILALLPNGVTIRGSVAVFTAATVTLSISAPPNAQPLDTDVYLGIRKADGHTSGLDGRVSLRIVVQ